MVESSWVRSIYLYLMCIASAVLVIVGLTSVAVGLVHAVAPDLGHRDTIDRVGIGLSNVGSGIVDLVNQGQLDEIQQFCEDITDGDEELEDCIDEQSSFGGESVDSIQQGITEIKDELRGQIRNSSIDRILRGLALTAAGVFLYRIHGPRTELFADGDLIPKRPAPPTPAAPSAPVYAPVQDPAVVPTYAQQPPPPQHQPPQPPLQ